MHSPVVGVILAGGQARRLGGITKGLLEIDGGRIVDRVARALRPLTSRLLLISSNPESRSWLAGAEVIADEHPGFGAAAGIASALRAARQQILAVAWDMPFVTTAMLEPLIFDPGDHDATMWQLPSGMEPLCACYRQTALPIIDSAIARGIRRARDIASLLHVRALSTEHLASASAALWSINTPSDLAWARQFVSTNTEAGSATETAQEEKDTCVT